MVLERCRRQRSGTKWDDDDVQESSSWAMGRGLESDRLVVKERSNVFVREQDKGEHLDIRSQN